MHQDLIADCTPNGRLEKELVAVLAHLFWRRGNLGTFRVAEAAQRRMAQIRSAIPSVMDVSASDQSVEAEKAFNQKCQAAEDQGRKELGELYVLVEMGEQAMCPIFPEPAAPS